MSERADDAVGSELANLRHAAHPAWVAALLDRAPPYVWVRFLMLRLLALVYLTAFWVALRQAVPLIGASGLLPAPDFLERVRGASGSSASALLELPTLFWFGYSDTALLGVAGAGVALSVAVLLGVTNAAAQFALWLLYLSIVQIGQRFYGYGWESQLLETGFLAIFLCPLRTLGPTGRSSPFVSVLLFRFLIWRIMLGSGLIKIRGDQCWRDFTCLFTHYETQPIPNPLSPWFHHAPGWFHRAGVAFNHAVELGAPWLAFGPRAARLLAGALFVAFQSTLIASGNLSFLNWLTIVPALACFDDGALARILPRRIRGSLPSLRAPASSLHQRSAIAYGCLVMLLSIQPVLNLISPQQAMNRSFDPLHLVNTYGAFGSVSRQRHEVILEGTDAARLDAAVRWQEYEFPCKPGDVRRRPCWISPYHLRLDWQMWFAALGNADRERWIVHLVYQLLSGDAPIKRLLARDPFAGQPPHFIRASFYRYRMSPPRSRDGSWWSRQRLGTYLQPLALDNPELRAFVASQGWRLSR
jgi:hypothetical protein